MSTYLVAVLRDGSVIDFDKQCNRVDYSNDKYVVFRNYDEKKHVFYMLAIIPHKNISMILSKKEGD